MSLLTLINNIPLYSTIEEANIWGSQYNMTGYHTHIYNSITGYMPGETHEEIKQKVSEGIQNFLTPQQLATGQFVVTVEAVQAYYQNQTANAPTIQTQQQVQPVIPQQNIIQEQDPFEDDSPTSGSGFTGGGTSGGSYGGSSSGSSGGGY